jgi:hypothetical protein
LIAGRNLLKEYTYKAAVSSSRIKGGLLIEVEYNGKAQPRRKRRPLKRIVLRKLSMFEEFIHSESDVLSDLP